jgi:3-(3-hydroxy-phenyl)propionate hydroxylase
VQYRQNLIPGLNEGALCADQGAPVGMRFPQPRIASKSGECLLDDMVGTSFRLVVSSELALRDVPERLRRKVVGLGGAVLLLANAEFSQPVGVGEWSIVEAEGVLNAWLHDHRLLAALVRPDHYVFAIARQRSDLSAMSDLLDGHLHLIGVFI